MFAVFLQYERQLLQVVVCNEDTHHHLVVAKPPVEMDCGTDTPQLSAAALSAVTVMPTSAPARKVVNPNALHECCGSLRDRRVNGTRVESVDPHGRAEVQIRVVYGVFGHYRRENE